MTSLRKKIGITSTAALMCGFATTAQAAIIDMGLTTLDTSTGLQWLDLTPTIGTAFMTPDEVALAVDTYEGGGWAIATSDEVLQFWTNITGNATWPITGWSTVDPALDGYFQAISSLVGTTQIHTSQSMFYGRAINSTQLPTIIESGLGMTLLANYPNAPAAHFDQNLTNFAVGMLPEDVAFVGMWMVRGRATGDTGSEISEQSVPAPAALGIFGLGLLGLGFARRRKSD